MVQDIALMRMRHQNSYQRGNSNNLSQISNGSNYTGRQAAKLIEKIREDGAAASDSCILR